MKKNVFSVVSAILFLGMIACVGHTAEVTKLKFAGYHPPTSMQSTLATQFCDEVKKRTNGRVEISYHPGGTLLAGPRIYDGVVQGLADIGHTNTGYTRGLFPVMTDGVQSIGLGSLAYPSAWVAGHAVSDFYNKFKPKEFNAVHPLFFYAISPQLIVTVKKPIRTIEDVKGLKIRAIGTDGDILKAVGMSPINLDSGDVYESLRREVIDGCFTTYETLKNFKYAEVTKYVLGSWQVGRIGVFFWIMNQDKYNALPADIKKIFDEVAAEYQEKTVQASNISDLESKEFFKSNGGQITTLSPAEVEKWNEKIKPVLAGHKKNLLAKGYSEQDLDAFVKYLKERIAYWTKAQKDRKIPTPFE
jgi:TRAP-type transport system periplasmic protein